MKGYYIDKRNKTINLSFDFDNEIIREVKSCGRAVHWNDELKIWVVPINAFSADIIKDIIKKHGFKKIEVKKISKVDYSYEVKNIDYEYLKDLVNSKELTYKPRDYQYDSLGYALQKGNHINGDDVGLGKTFESILYAEVTESFPCLVICPASLKEQWAEKWLEINNNKRSVGVIYSKETKKRKNNWNADIVIINYDIIGKKKGAGAVPRFDEISNTDWKMVIFDEAHFLKNAKSIRSKTSVKITKPNNLKIQLLTGTAIMSRPVEIWNLLKIGKIDKFISSSWMSFVRRYCGAHRGANGLVTSGATFTMELNKKLRENCYIRREKREVLKDLPEAIPQIFQVPISNQKDINEATNNLIEFIRKTKGDEAAEKAMEAEVLVSLGVMRKLAIEGKMKAIVQYLKDWKESGIKMVVFGVHRDPLIQLAEIFNCPLIIGGVKSSKKREIVNSWKNSEDVFLFANMDSAGTGTDGLQDVCHNMSIIELPWRPSDLEQVIGRLDRSGQTLPPNINYLLNNDTIDDQMWSMLEEKEEVTEAVNKGIDVNENQSGLRTIIRKFIEKHNIF